MKYAQLNLDASIWVSTFYLILNGFSFAKVI